MTSAMKPNHEGELQRKDGGTGRGRNAKIMRCGVLKGATIVFMKK